MGALRGQTGADRAGGSAPADRAPARDFPVRRCRGNELVKPALMARHRAPVERLGFAVIVVLKRAQLRYLLGRRGNRPRQDKPLDTLPARRRGQ